MNEKKLRLSKDTIACYNSFEEAAKAWGCRPVKKKTDDAEKLQKQQEKFVGKCRVCGQNLTYVYGTNILACTNETCKGVKMTGKNEDGTERIYYIPVTRILDDVGMDIAMNLFS
jgi:hypothetical protein